MRLITSLDALAHGATTGEVGILMALITLIPVFLSMRCGRWIDAIGFRKPLVLSSCLILLAGTVPTLFPTADFGLPPLAVSCILNGTGNMIFSIVSALFGLERLLQIASVQRTLHGTRFLGLSPDLFLRLWPATLLT